MRTNDGLLALVGAMLGFGAVVVGLEGAGWPAVTTFAALSAVLFLLAGFRALVTPSVLLVGDPDGPAGGRLGVITAALEEGGFAVRSCSGPTHGGCPVLEGKPCPVERSVSGVMVFHPATYTGPVPPCGEALQRPEVLIEADSDHEPEIGTDFARVGAARGAGTAVRTLQALMA